MLKRFSRLFTAVALICAVGGHWAVLQSVAWVSMVAAYSRGASLPQAIARTFDGRHPCQICQFVAEGKKSEKQKEQHKLVVKLDLFAEIIPVTFDAPPAEAVLSPGSRHAPSRCDAPPLPPPIGA